MPLHVDFSPAFNFASDRHETEVGAGGAVFRSPDLTLGLSTAVPLTPDQNGVSAELRLEEGESAVFVLEELKAHARCGPLLSDAAADRLMREIGRASCRA